MLDVLHMPFDVYRETVLKWIEVTSLIEEEQ